MELRELPALDRRISIREPIAIYPHMTFVNEQELVYSSRLVRTGRNYYGTRSSIPKGHRMSTAAEELAIQLSLESQGLDPLGAEDFRDLRGKNTYGWYGYQWNKDGKHMPKYKFGLSDMIQYIRKSREAKTDRAREVWRGKIVSALKAGLVFPYYHWDAWQWTDTALRVPKGRDAEKYETGSKGRKYWSRRVVVGNIEIGEVLVPEGNGQTVVEWDTVFGLPKNTEDTDGIEHATRFWFDASPSVDNVSNGQDVAVGRGIWWTVVSDKADFGFDVGAIYRRDAPFSSDGLLYSCDGYRLVKVRVPHVRRV